MLAGRIGSGIAAEIGSMVVTDQINALRALGTDPVQLVVPRVVAGFVMAPILTIIADTVGIIGGWMIAVFQLRVASSVYWTSVIDGLYPDDAWMGIIKPFCLGYVIVTIGCHVGPHVRQHAGCQPLDHAGGGRGVGRRHRGGFLCEQAIVTLLYVGRLKAAPECMPDASIVLKNVSLAFDEKVVLKDVSFELLPGHTKVILGGSGSGKVDHSQAHTRVAEARWR